MQCDGISEQCGTLKSLIRRKTAAEAALKRKQTFIANLDAEIGAHSCKSRSNGAAVPSVDLNSFGAFNYRELVEGVYGDRFAEDWPVADLQPEINLALERLRPMERFVLELRMRGVTLERAAQVIGWKTRERVRQVEAMGFRHLRYPSRSAELSARIKAYEHNPKTPNRETQTRR